MLQKTPVTSTPSFLSKRPLYSSASVENSSFLSELKANLGIKETEDCLQLLKTINHDWEPLDYIMPPPRFRRLAELFSLDTRALLLQINQIMAEFSEKFIQPLSITLPKESEKRHYCWLMRVLSEIRSPGYAESSLDTLAKDRAIISGQMLYLGSRVAKLARPFPRKHLLKLARSHPQLIIKSIKNRFRLHGLELHSEARSVDLFTEVDFKKMLNVLQQIIRDNKKVDLAFGAAWFYAPEMAKVSPHLMYMREEVFKRGGTVFHCGSGGTEDALYNSRTRRRAYLAGDYVPERYGLVIT